MAITSPLVTEPPARAADGHAPTRAVPAVVAAPMTVSAAVRRHWLAALLPLVLTCTAAAAFGLQRAPVYTATASLSAGAINVSAPGALGGYATASATLAATWSRSLTADAVLTPVSRILHRPAAELAPRLSASPIPQSPVFRVRATGDSRAAAIALANVATRSLVGYVGAVGRHDAQRAALARRVEHDAAAVARAGVDAQLAAERLRDGSTGARRRALADARARLQLAQLRYQVDREAYKSVEAARTAAPRVRVLHLARAAASDRQRTVELLLIAGAVVGCALGAAAATLRARRVARRAAS